jgi:hypothetical protein
MRFAVGPTVSRAPRPSRLVPTPNPARSLALCFNFATFPAMSTVTEIEAALEKLPPEQLQEVAAWLETRLAPETPAMLAALDAGIRSLETETTVSAADLRQKIKTWATG